MSRRGSIRLHPEYGLNPTLCVCFWCGKDRGDIAMLGWNDGKEAPRRCVVDLGPCDVCLGQWQQGILIREARQGLQGPEFTGRWMVMKREAAAEVIKPESLAQEILEKGHCVVRPEDWEKLFGELEKEGDGGDGSQ